MKKLTLFLVCAAFISGTALMNAQLTFGSYHIVETFEGLTALPEGWTTEVIGGVEFTVADGQVNIDRQGTASVNAPRAAGITFPASPESTEFAYVEFDFMLGPNFSCIREEPMQAVHLSFGANAIFHSEVIFEFIFHGSSSGGSVHLQNLDLSHIALDGSGTDNNNWCRPVGWSSGGNTGTVIYSNFENTATEIAWVPNTTYKIKAFLDFKNHKVAKIYIGDTMIGENLGFISPTANNIAKIAFVTVRGNNGDSNFTGTKVSYLEVGSISEIPSSVLNPGYEKNVVSRIYFDILGKQVSKETKGLVIEKLIFDDGSHSARKFFKQ